MGIQIANLLKNKAAIYGASATNKTFRNAFLEAVNSVVEDINARLGISLDEVTSTDTDVDIDAAGARVVFIQGIDVYIADTGVWTIKDPEKASRNYERSLGQLWQSYTRGIFVSPGLGNTITEA